MKYAISWLYLLAGVAASKQARPKSSLFPLRWHVSKVLLVAISVVHASMPERASDFVKTTVYLLVNAMPFARDEARALSLRLLLFSNHL